MSPRSRRSCGRTSDRDLIRGQRSLVAPRGGREGVGGVRNSGGRRSGGCEGVRVGGGRVGWVSKRRVWRWWERARSEGCPA